MELYGINIPEDDYSVRIRQLYCNGMEKLRILSTKCPFYKTYWQYGSIPEVVKCATRDLYQIFLGDAIRYILTNLNLAKIYDYDTKRIADVYSKYATNYIRACKSIYADYCEIQGDTQSARIAREEAKAGRGRFVGGGFGVSGAAKGIAMAGVANLATGAIYSAGNMIGNTLTQMSADSKADSLYRSQKTAKKLYEALQQDFLIGVDVLEFILVSSIGPEMKNPFDDQGLKKANAIMNNIKSGIVPESEQRKLLVETMINDAPYYDEIYLFAYELFGDDNSKLIEVAKLFGKDDIIERIKNKIRSETLEQKRTSLEQSVFGGNFETVHQQMKIDGKFFDFNDFYFYPVYGMYIDQSFPMILKRLCMDLKDKKEMSGADLTDLVLFEDLSNKTEEIQKYRTLCDPLDLFQPEETAYCFINLGITKDSKGILVTSKGLYFSPNCKIDQPFMRYDGIDGIIENYMFGVFLYNNKRVVGLEANISKKWAKLLRTCIHKRGNVW